MSVFDSDIVGEEMRSGGGMKATVLEGKAPPAADIRTSSERETSSSSQEQVPAVQTTRSPDPRLTSLVRRDSIFACKPAR